MKTVSSISENIISTTTPPITDMEEIIKAICEWNEMTVDSFKSSIWSYHLYWTDSDGKKIYVNDSRTIIDPIWMFLVNAYHWKWVVFEKWNDKFFWKIRVTASGNTRYQLGDKIIEIPFSIRTINEDTQDSITMFPKMSDFIQPRMKTFYIVNTGWSERQRLEKEIMSKLIELAQVRGWNEIISTQNVVEELKETLKKRGIILDLWERTVELSFPRRTIHDTANQDADYIAPPIQVQIDFESRRVESKWYSCHWFGTPNSWWNPCWWNRDNEIHECLRNCDLKALINLIISWAYGYNSNDTGRSHDGRHPLWKLKDYIWYAYDHRDESNLERTEWIVKNLEAIKHDLNIDNWLDSCQDIKNFISDFEEPNAEQSEEW